MSFGNSPPDPLLDPKPPRNRIAFFSPYPPVRCGLSDYSAELLEKLADRYSLDLFHAAGYQPELAARLKGDFRCWDYRQFGSAQATRDYAGIVYQMANTHDCDFVYDSLLKWPGIVVLHDLILTEFMPGYALRSGLGPRYLLREIAYENPELSAEFASAVAAWEQEPGGITAACLRRGLKFHRRILEHASAIVVHSRWVEEQIRQSCPDVAQRVRLIPMGITPENRTHQQRQAIRGEFGLAPDALVVASFGFINNMKYNLEIVTAFASLAESHPSACLLFVGRDLKGGEMGSKVAALKLGPRVRFYGHTSLETFTRLMAVTDIAVNLRSPPTRGETSAALLRLLALGIVTIVTDVDSFSGFPDDVVRKVPPLSSGEGALITALRELAADPALRGRFSSNAAEYVRAHHDWNKAAALYAQVIEETRREQGPLSLAKQPGDDLGP